MAQMTLPAAPNYKRTSYSKLLGCDFSIDPSQVNNRRSPSCLNMISDNGGNPVKRKGWEIINNTYAGEIENIWTLRENNNIYIVFTNTYRNESTLHCIDENGTEYELVSEGNVNVAIGKLCAYYTNISNDQHGLYIIDEGACHRVYYDNGIKHEEVTPFIPTILISRDPTGGGVVYDDINLLTRQRTEMFYNDVEQFPNNKDFVVSSSINTSKPYKFEYMDSEGEWKEDESITVNGATFTASEHYAPVTNGKDNIKITYYAVGDDNKQKILNCKSCAHYSSGFQDQIFVTGNVDDPNTIYYSAKNNISYFPDLNYISIGGENTIAGFLNLGDYLAVVKSGTSLDTSVFLIQPTSIKTQTVVINEKNTSTTNIDTFSIKRTTSGIGAISDRAFGVLNDEPLFLSKFGIYGIASVNVLSDKIIRNRSFFIDQKLVNEVGLESAVGTVWKNYFVVVANSHAYILDGRHKSNDQTGNTSYGYEAYYWDNIPAISITSYDEELIFGTADGKICRFKNTGMGTDYSDGTVRSDSSIEGTPIIAEWSTPFDNDGITEYYKTMMKKGTMCTIVQKPKTSVKVYIKSDDSGEIYIGEKIVDTAYIFDGVIDFSDLYFNIPTEHTDVFFRKKRKKYKRIQIILRNDSLNEPFGVLEIVKTYTIQRFAKR